MKYFLRGIVLILVIAFLGTMPVHAGDYISDAIEALKTSNVYVAPGTPGTNIDTASELKGFLTDTDSIVLVMLPEDALTDTTINSIVERISAGLDNRKTIGLAVGRNVIGYSVILSPGIAADKMLRADSVANDPITALITFTQNIHSWQSKNPQPIPTATPIPTPTPRPTAVPIELPKIDTSTTQSKVVIGFTIFLMIISVVVVAIKLAPQFKRNLKFAPATKTLRTIEDLLPNIEDSDIKKELTKACKLGHGLLNIFKRSRNYTGIVEDLFPLLLINILTQIKALILHESGTQPLADGLLEQMTQSLLSMDDLFKKLQEGDPATVDLLASILMSENAIVSHLGYFPTKK